jgi:acyl carrier protein
MSDFAALIWKLRRTALISEFVPLENGKIRLAKVANELSNRARYRMTSDMSAISRDVHAFILREFLPGEKPENLTDSTPLITGGVLDSIGVLKLAKYLEENYQIQMEAHEFDPEYLDNISLIADYVRSKLATE